MEQAQRTKILETMVELVAERGPGADPVTEADVAARAGVSRASFEALFGDREDCLLSAFELALQRAGAEISGAYHGEARWLDAIRAALARSLWFIEAEPAMARLLVVYSAGAGPRVQQRRMDVLALLASVVDRGRSEAPAGSQQPPVVMAEGVIGAVLAVVQNRMLAGDRQTPADLFGPLISIIVLPFLGAGAARRELSRPAPRMRARGEELAQSLAGDQLGGRLTYRTARVLIAIEDYPGASNREVAERAGIVDQGQISKLLGRLESRGLIEKAGEARTRGAPNSWRLSGEGESLVRSVGLRAAVRSSKAPST